MQALFLALKITILIWINFFMQYLFLIKPLQYNAMHLYTLTINFNATAERVRQRENARKY